MILKDSTFEVFLIDSCNFRKGILLTLENQEGVIAHAEVSPLPGFSKETIEEALEQLIEIKRKLMGRWWSTSALDALNNWELYPSVHFGLESALLHLLDPIKDTPVHSYGLLLGSKEEILFRANELKEEGIKEVKVKLGHLSLQEAAEIINAIKGHFTFRIDLNRKWPLQQTLSLCAKYPENFFTYIEEPCQEPKDLLHFPYPFAIDETLRETHLLQKLLPLEPLRALIVKPTMQYPCKGLLSLGKEIVITSSFEGALGILQIKKLIARLGLTKTYHGLDTLRYVENLPYRPLSGATT